MPDANLSQLDIDSLWHPLTQHQGLEATPPRFIERAEGCYLYDADGNRFLDAVSGLWCVNVGHGREELAEVAAEQMKKLAYLPGTMSHEPAVRLAARLVNLLGYPARVYFSNSGSEANEAAFKMARQYQANVGGGRGVSRSLPVTAAITATPWAPFRPPAIGKGGMGTSRWSPASSSPTRPTRIVGSIAVSRSSRRPSCARERTAWRPSSPSR